MQRYALPRFWIHCKHIRIGAILNGTYAAPKDSDAATKELFAKIAAICKLIPEKLVSITIMLEQWKQY
jgi:hypothetical protein